MKTRNEIHRLKQSEGDSGMPAIDGKRSSRSNGWPVQSLLSRGLPVICFATMTATSAFGLTAEILANGHFESPALPGAGDVWSSSPGFSLPGWTYPTGSNQLYIEFGGPLGSARYSDGRQAVCLHGQGTPVSISQTFPTIPGGNYTVSFAQSDESNSGPSESQLTVGVGGLLRVFPNLGGYHVYDDHGYKIRAFSFTARSNQTTLTFTDTSPAGVPSPLIDGVCVNPSSGSVARTGGTSQFINLGNPGVSANLSQYVAVFIGAGSGGSQGIFLDDDYCGNGIPHLNFTNPPPPISLVDTTVSIPGGVGTFQGFSPGSQVALNPQPFPPVSVSGDNAFFWASGLGTQQGLYSVGGVSSGAPGTVQRLADIQTPMPGRAENFANFTPRLNGTNYPAQIAADGNNSAFWGQAADDWDGVYCGTVPFHVGPPPPPILNLVADRATLIPGSAVPFSTFVNPGMAQGPQPLPWKQIAIRGNNIVFYGAGSAALGLQGLYCAPVPAAGTVANQSNLFAVVDTTVAIPGGSNNFTGFGSFDFANRDELALGRQLSCGFIGMGSGGQQGVYDDEVPYCGNNLIPIPRPGPGPVWLVADRNTAIPQGLGNFTGFENVACGGPYGISIAFVGLGAGGQKGIYAQSNPMRYANSDPMPAMKIIDLNDTIDGKTIADLQLAPGAINGFVLAYKAVFTDGSQGIYVTPLVVNVLITSMAISGNDIQLSFTAPASRNYAIVGSTDVTHHGTNVVSGAIGTGGLASCTVSGGFSRFNDHGYYYSVFMYRADPGALTIP